MTLVLFKLWLVWRKHPHLRLGQLIMNAMRGTHMDPFYITDDLLIRALKRFDEEVSLMTRR